MNIELHIDELILHGFKPHNRYRIAEAVQNELTRLLEAGEIPLELKQDLEFPRLDGGSFGIRAGERPESIGRRIGQAVFDSVRGEELGVKSK